MTRTGRKRPNNAHGIGQGIYMDERRRYEISKAATKLLRHQAQNEKIPITAQGWVKLSDLLNWSGFHNKQRFDPAVTTEDIFIAVEDDGKHGKGRFALKLVGEDATTSDGTVVDVDGAGTGELVDATKALEINEQDVSSEDPSIKPTSKNNPETVRILAQFFSNPSDSSSYMIRATQGHSIQAVESDGLHTPITLDDLSTIPDTVVHGTFYGAWGQILVSGGLKAMGRNMVHFATGPSLSEVMPAETGERSESKNSDAVKNVLGKNKVTSGMRSDAQILIYVDLKRCLEDVKANDLDMEWFRSDNGVILTAGVAKTETLATLAELNRDKKQWTARTGNQDVLKLVPMKYWSTVVEIKQGWGVLWTHRDGMIKELSTNLGTKSLPYGKQRQTRGNQQKSDKPNLKVEKGVIDEDS